MPVGFSAVLLAVMLSTAGSGAVPHVQPATDRRSTSVPDASAIGAAASVTAGAAIDPAIVAASNGTPSAAAVTDEVATGAPPTPAEAASLPPVPPLGATGVVTATGTATTPISTRGAHRGTGALTGATAVTPDAPLAEPAAAIEPTGGADAASLGPVPDAGAGVTATLTESDEPPVPSTVPGDALTTAAVAGTIPTDPAANPVPTDAVPTDAVSTTALPAAAESGTIAPGTTTPQPVDASTVLAASGLVAPPADASGARSTAHRDHDAADTDAPDTDIAAPTGAGTGQPVVAVRADAATTAHTGAAASTNSTGVYNVDRIRYVRAMAPNREVQRLALDLDGARVSVRLDGGRATVGIVSDPDDTLGSGWIRQVERTIDQTARAATGSSGAGGQHLDGRSGQQPGQSGGELAGDARQRRAHTQSTLAQQAADDHSRSRWIRAAQHLALHRASDTTVLSTPAGATVAGDLTNGTI